MTQALQTLASLAILVGLGTLSLAFGEAKPAEVRIGATRTLIRGGDDASAEASGELLATMLSTQAGVRMPCTLTRDGAELARQLESGQVLIGLMPGIELAWAQKRDPNLKPLLLTCNEHVGLKAFLLVRAEANLSNVEALKGKTLSFPRLNLNHCYLFLDRAIREAGHDPARFFAQCRVANNADDALEAVLEGQAHATVIDEVGFDVFRKRKPGRARKLQTLKESPRFPCAAMVYTPEKLNGDVLKKVYDNLSTTHERATGRQMLSLMRLTDLRPTSDDYQQLLKGILKEYPSPVDPVNFTLLNGADKATTQQPK
jgi:ABC-type phosphate/phosphonate transport system substrate-binding protein